MKKSDSKGSKKFINGHYLMLFLALIAITIGGWLFYQPAQKSVEAAAPASGSLGNTVGATVTWTGTKTGIPPAANGEPSCNNDAVTGQNCDDYTLTVTGVPTDWTGKRIRIRFTWNLPSTDYDMVVRKESNGIAGLQGDGLMADTANLDSTIGTSGNGTNTFEEVVISPAESGVGVYYVRSIYFAGSAGDQYNGSAMVFEVSSTLTPGTCAEPQFDNYQPPAGMPRRDNAGEPSIGVNWNTGNIMAMARLTGYRASFSDSTSPANPTTGVNWLAKAIPNVATGFDPILFTDPITGRTIGGELVIAAGTTQGGVSDDDLNTFTATFQTGGPVQGFDHQTIAGGPPKAGATVQPTGAYPHMFYYATQQAAYATMAASVNGGISYLPAVPMYTMAQCGGLHGHVKVAPDGTVYLPNKNCGGKAAVIVSENNGMSFSIRPIPQSSRGDDDPSVAIGAGGRVYVAYTDDTLKPHVAVSDDRGLTWRDDNNIGLGVPGLRAAVFPAMVAGDNNRAALFFLATDSTNPNDPTGVDGATTGVPDPDLADNFLGTWYPYIATTCDGGKSWSVVRADSDPLRPGMKNPAQQGVICKNGTTCPDTPKDTRNLLDFNDATVDSKGRIVAVYADGCISANCISLPDNTAAKEDNDGSKTLTIIRQRSGMRLFAAFDPGGPAAPALSPPAFAEANPRGVTLKWATPDDNGSPLTAYRIYRGATGSEEQLVGEVQPDTHTFNVRVRNPGAARSNYFRVTAVNAYGESPRNVKITAGE